MTLEEHIEEYKAVYKCFSGRSYETKSAKKAASDEKKMVGEVLGFLLELKERRDKEEAIKEKIEAEERGF